MDRAWLARQLYKMEIIPTPMPEGFRSSWLHFGCDLDVIGKILDTFVDSEAALIVRDRLIAWAWIWATSHPAPEYRPWYGAVAVAAEAGDWNGVRKLCQALLALDDPPPSDEIKRRF